VREAVSARREEYLFSLLCWALVFGKNFHEGGLKSKLYLVKTTYKKKPCRFM
jgi:hypothetical protein